MSNLAMVKFRESTGAQRKEFFESVGWVLDDWTMTPAMRLDKSGYKVVVFIDGLHTDQWRQRYIALHASYVDYIILKISPNLRLFEVNLMARDLLANGLFFDEKEGQTCP